MCVIACHVGMHGIACPGDIMCGDGDVAIGRRAGGDTDEEAEEGLEQFVVIILFDVTSIVESF